MKVTYLLIPDPESILEYGQYLYKNEQRTSENKKFKLKIQDNGNLILYLHRVLNWQSPEHIRGKPNARGYLQRYRLDNRMINWVHQSQR